jgi:hypothetical protein
MIVLHGPSGGKDNRLGNLSYGTPYENAVRDRIRDGTFLLGEQHQSARLTENEVRAIRASTERGRALSKRFGVSEATVCAIRKLKAWTHLD